MTPPEVRVRVLPLLPVTATRLPLNASALRVTGAEVSAPLVVSLTVSVAVPVARLDV